MRKLRELTGLLLWWVAGLFFCLHPVKIRRRNKDGVMGLECFGCYRWWPLGADLRKRSKLAQKMAKRQALSRLRAREVRFSPRQAERLMQLVPASSSTGKEGSHGR